MCPGGQKRNLSPSHGGVSRTRVNDGKCVFPRTSVVGDLRPSKG